MANHPARPKGYRPFVTPDELRRLNEAMQSELEAIQAWCDDYTYTAERAPILDRLAADNTDWHTASTNLAVARFDMLAELTAIQKLLDAEADTDPGAPLVDRLAAHFAAEAARWDDNHGATGL